ncbi:MAG: hypothetical protein P8P20_00680, partial [Acidimicrobiales bacterium]|nr:hypothetical protein [Acidimicrobiales bacterium]
GIEITPEDRQYVIRAGGGSARDTLSALDQVVAAGGAPQGGEHLEALFQSLIDRDAAQALTAIDGALQAGRDAASIGTSLLHELRTVFLAAMRADLGHLPQAERDRAVARAASMPPARITRAIEVIGTSIIEMRQAPDPRVDLEVAIMRLTRADLDTNPAALVERLEAIESQLTGGAPIVAPAPAPAIPASPAIAQPTPARAPDPAPVAVAPSQPQTPQPVPAPQPQTPQPVPAPQAPPSGGHRGADMVRAELVKQGIASAPPVTTAEAAPEPSAPAPAPASTGKTLADVRRERQAAAHATGATQEDPAVAQAAAERRERQAAAKSAGQAAAPAQPSPTQHEYPVEQATTAPATSSPAATTARAGEAAVEPVIAVPVEPVAAPPPEVPHAQPAVASPGTHGGPLPTLAELNGLWQALLESMSGKVRSRFSAGHFMETSPDSLIFGLPNPVHRDRCEEIRAEVDQALAARFGRPMPLSLVVDMIEEEPDFFAAAPSGGAGVIENLQDTAHEEATVDVHDLVDATDDVASAEDRVMATFENSTLLEDPQNNFPNQ